MCKMLRNNKNRIIFAWLFNPFGNKKENEFITITSKFKKHGNKRTQALCSRYGYWWY